MTEKFAVEDVFTNSDDAPTKIGSMFIQGGMESGRIWIGYCRGPKTGEGGYFDPKELAEWIKIFYEAKF
jgi:hypothetical protein